MNKIERISEVLRIINEKGIMLTKDVAHHFPKFSLMTLNRDLKFLENSQLIVKVSLGYCSISYSQKQNIQKIIATIPFVEAKNQIAQKAVKLINNNEVLYFSPGTTSEYVVKKITQNCTIFTNSWNVYQIAHRKKNLLAILIGGETIGDKNIFFGSETIKAIQAITFDKIFLSVSGFSTNGEMLNTNKEEALVETIAASVAKKIVVIADSSKFHDNNKGNYKFFSLADCDYLITDQPVNLTTKYQNLKQI